MSAGVDGDETPAIQHGPCRRHTRRGRFTVTGSGTELAIGYLEESYKKGITTKEAVKIVARALAIAMKRNSATGGRHDNMRQ